MGAVKELPPMDLQKSRKTLVLDLNGTLLHVSQDPLPDSLTVEFKIEGMEEMQKLYVIKRPGLDELLQELCSIYEMVIFTENGKNFTDALLKQLDPNEAAIPMTHRLYADSCVVKNPITPVFIKDLSLLDRDLSKVILVDDKPYYTYQCENGFPVSVFKGDKDDRMLFQLIDFCKRVADRNSDIREDIASYPLSVYNNCLLPPVDHGKFTLVLELKGVLVDINPVYQKWEFKVEYGFGGEMHKAFVKKRPGLDKFLEALQGLYEIVVFTEAERPNASAVLDKLDPDQKVIPITHRLFRNSCTETQGGLVKDLSKLGRDLEKVIYVDVWPCVSLQPENLLTVDSFRRDMQVMDSALFHLMDFCSHVAESRPLDVRMNLAAEKEMKEEQNKTEDSPWLPPMEGNYKKTVVLNLDGTVIQSSTSQLPRYDFRVELEGLQRRQTCYVLKRPGLEELLNKLPDLGYEIVIFTSAEKGFVDAVLEKLDNPIRLTHRFDRRHCRRLPNSVLIKDLSMLGRDLSQLILVDGRPYFSYQSENAFPVSEFIGDTNDTALFEVMEFCKRLANFTASSDVRKQLLSYAQMLSYTHPQVHMLPPMAKSDRDLSKKTLVLDLDETLVHSTVNKLPKRHDFAIQFRHPDGSYIYYVLKRPWVDLLLNELRNLYEIVVFTASGKKYADAILNKLDPHGNIIKHRLYRNSCTQLPGPNSKPVKDLSRLGRSLSKVIFVDDSYRHHCAQENAFPVRRFLDDMNDTELLSLLEFCKRFANSESDARTDILSHAFSRHNGCPGWN
ncbi:hypothetical protein SUGI_0068310 [Cryptomeria japonica]|nr:hypothetical protein SUGI_0068310 [Cryptomeria japonica]